jgi:tetratricopeptide (TPR) repeat protein
MNKLNRISNIIIIVVIILFAFVKHVVFGIAAILIYLTYLAYRKRNRIFISLANAALHKGDIDLSLQWLEKAYQVNPNHPQIATTYGYNLLKYGQIEQAEKVLEKLLQSNLTELQKSTVNMNLALIHWKQDRLDEAITMLEEIHEKMKTSVLYGSLGYMYIEQDKLDTALQYNLEAYDYNDTYTVILDNLGLTYIKLKDWAKAEEIYAKLITLKPKFPEAYYHAGLVQLNKGDLDLAYNAFCEALEQPFTSISTEPRELIEIKKSELEQTLKNSDDQQSIIEPL